VAAIEAMAIAAIIPEFSFESSSGATNWLDEIIPTFLIYER
jgi:hypothetical protein